MCFVALLSVFVSFGAMSYGLFFTLVSTASVDDLDIFGYAVFFVVTGESQA